MRADLRPSASSLKKSHMSAMVMYCLLTGRPVGNTERRDLSSHNKALQQAELGFRVQGSAGETSSVLLPLTPFATDL